MPERSEIAIMAFQLNSLLKDKICDKVIITKKYKAGYLNGLYSSSKLNYQEGENFKYVNVGYKITNVTSRGKKIIFEFDDNCNDKIRFVSACGLDGRWSLNESKYTCIVLMFKDFFVYYEQIRIGGNFSICRFPSSEYDHIFSAVGPDWINDETSWPIFYSIMRNPKTVNWTISDYMIDQKFMSGVGNFIKAEVLYKSLINPKRILNSLSDLDLHNIWVNTKNTIFESFNLNGLTIKNYRDLFGNIGKYVPVCYGRKIDDFGNPIITESDKKERKIYWCPNLQK